MTTKKTQQHKGFTLIELLVVISIISLLASVVLTNLNEARGKAYDATRESDMIQIRNALELFYHDNGGYPGASHGVSNGGEIIGVGNPIDTALSPYLTTIPIDPKHDAGTGLTPVAGAVYFYAYDPQHMLDAVNCDSVAGYPSGVTFGFNRGESGGPYRKDTCSGSNVNLDNADYNQGFLPAGI